MVRTISAMRPNRLHAFALLLSALALAGCSARLLKRRSGSVESPALSSGDVISVFGSTASLLTEYDDAGTSADTAQAAQNPATYDDAAQAGQMASDAGAADGDAIAAYGGEHPTADGLYTYLVEAGFQLSSPSPLQSTHGAEHALTFVLSDHGRAHRFELYEFANAAGARALHAAFNTHKLTGVCGPLVLTADFPLPRAQTAAGIENALDIYVAKAQHGVLSEMRLASADPHASLSRPPVHAVRKMFMLSRDAVVYSDPSTASSAIATVQEDTYVRVIDLLPNFLKVRLLGGQVGFVPESAVE